ncbi:hypothetical protein [Sphingobium sp. Z007]|uniref:hypothetical protein n=1 Tax=Sphingobium sp. Z007 TaxID=627495 RepID=UPI001595B87F|nr:hypothetical protein [Sphingobium sp. Z007]
MTDIRLEVAGFAITTRIGPAPLGWRFWTLAGFPCADQDGAEEFARDIVEQHAQQPKLL